MRFNRIVYTNLRSHLPDQRFANIAFDRDLAVRELAPLFVLKHDPDGVSLVRVRFFESMLVILAQ